MTLDPDQLRAFVTVADTGSFTRAADRLNRTQAAVSMQVKRLEEQLGRSLLDRQPRGVRLAPDGEQLIGFARQILALNEQAIALLTQPQPAGVVRLGTPDDYATSFLPPILSRFARACPLVQVDVVSDLSVDLVGAVDRGEIDLTLLTRSPETPRGTLLRREPLVWAAAAGSPALQAVPLPLALCPHGCLFRRLAIDALSELGRDWRLAYVSPSLAALTAAVGAGLAITVLTRSSVPDSLKILGADSGLPALPPIEIALHHRGLDAAAELLRRHIITGLGTGPDLDP